MQPSDRREIMLRELRETENPLTGGQLAEKYGVSRQVIVQDMAVLRAAGHDILATAQGYMIPRGSRSGEAVAFVCRHSGRDAMREELYIMVDAGACVMDVIVEHPVYGEIRGELMLDSRRKVDLFLEKLDAHAAEPLAVTTAGVHVHTLRVENAAMADAVAEALRARGILAEEGV